jgi:hypothetical protein
MKGFDWKHQDSAEAWPREGPRANKIMVDEHIASQPQQHKQESQQPEQPRIQASLAWK